MHSAEVPAASRGSTPSLSSVGVRGGPGLVSGRQPSVGRRGKAPPVDPFSSENPEVRLDDWLDRAAEWNGWSDSEALMQLAGHLRGKALQEWNLLNSEQKTTYVGAISALRLRIDPQNRVIVATDFRHALQAEEETVADYVRRIERLFQIAYGGDSLSSQTKDTMLHSQLHGGLRYDLMRSPTVSGAQSYQELCLAVRQEEKRLAELKRRQQYTRNSTSTPPHNKRPPAHTYTPSPATRPRTGNLCNSPDHFARECKLRKQESRPENRFKGGQTRSVWSHDQVEDDDPRQYLHSSDEDQ